jgi:fused signal recognition particle receptor
MTDFLREITNSAWFSAITDIINTILTDYLLETSGILVLFLFVLVVAKILKNRKRRKRLTYIDQEATAEEIDMPRSPVAKEPFESVDEPFIDTRAPAPVSVLGRLKSGLQKTRSSLAGRIDHALSHRNAADREAIEEIEEALITSDVGVATTMALIEKIEKNASSFNSPDDLRNFLKSEMLEHLTWPKKLDTSAKPCVIMVVGVNGAGKTTTIGKLAHKFQAEGKKVLIGAADTFRAAAVEQLAIWAERSGAEIVRHRDNADPAAVAFDAVEAGLSRGSDIVIIDTAGRLQTKVNLMEELKKIKRSITKKLPDAPHEVLLVLDATTGQNAISQAKTFHEGIGVTSLVLTKLDGTAKGGIVIGICSTMKLPLQYIGVGEAIEDLQEFDPKKFIDAIF